MALFVRFIYLAADIAVTGIAVTDIAVTDQEREASLSLL